MRDNLRHVSRLTFAVIFLMLLAIVPGAARGASVSSISRLQTGEVADDPLTTGNTGGWSFWGDAVTESPPVSLDKQVVASSNTGPSLPPFNIGTSKANELIVIAISSTCGATAACSTAPSVSSVNSAPSLTWALRDSAANGGVGVAEYWAAAAAAANYKISLTLNAPCACVANAFSLFSYDTLQPFGTKSSATGSSSTPSVSTSSFNQGDLIIGLLAQGAATQPPKLQIASYGSGFAKINQKSTGNNGNPQQFNVQGAAEDESAVSGTSGVVSFTTGGSYPWALLVDSVQAPRYYSYSEDSQGLHIGVRAVSAGNYAGFFAVTGNTVAQLFHATIVLSNKSIPSNNFDTGMYVQNYWTPTGTINYVFCGASVTPSGYYWSVVYTTGNSNSATTFNTVYSSPGGPLTRDCTIVTNGSNMLRVYLDGALVYSSSSLALNMPSPFNAYLEVESSYSPSSLWGEYRDYYAASSETVTLKSASPGDVAKIVDSSGGVLASAPVNSSGVAALDVGQFQQPVDGSVQLYDGAGALLASTQSPGPIWGGDAYQVSSGSYSGPTPPSAPTGLNAAAISASQINLSWTVPFTDGGSPITGYTIQRSSDGGSSWSTIVSSTGSTSTTYSDTGLSASQTYTYQVEALNSVGSSPPSNTASLTTSPPTNSTITVNTVNSQNQPIQGYYIALFRNGVQVDSCFSWCSFTVTDGATYQIAAESYGSESFSHWSDGTTGDPYTVIVPATSTTITLTAVYSP